jgi:iron complex transport system ATP-binding protein
MGWISQNFLSPNNKKFESNLKSISEECCLTDMLARKFNRLSGGEQRRVHFARGLMQLMNPMNLQHSKYFLLDEPTSSMDIYFELHVMETIRKIANTGIGILLIMHDLNLASKFSDKIILMSKSKIVKSGIPSQVFEEKTLSDVYGLQMKITSDPLRIYYY